MRRLNSILAPPALGVESPGGVRRGTLAFALLLLLAAVGIPFTTAHAQEPPRPAAPADSSGEASYGPRSPEVKALEAFLNGKTPLRLESLNPLREAWNLCLVPMILDSVNLMPLGDRRRAPLFRLLRNQTGQSFGPDPLVWFKWLWKQDVEPHPDYPEFRVLAFWEVDPRFQWWFYRGMPHTIRLDEIMWGGVKVDGIPPLEHPAVIKAEEASYLGGNNVVFGVYLNGEARAYPKRILAWHEMANDTVGGVDVSLAYCTLCGSAILYDQKIGGWQSDFGTSGFLYRSNKLMYDRKTRSLWSTFEGVPVTGKLVGSGLQLNRLPIVTTTWKAWREAHPSTTVLSIETGHKRDYGEGAAYRDYFSSHKLMFPVPFDDQRLKNKQEVLTLLLGGEAAAFDISFLRKNPLHHDKVGRLTVAVLTDRSGANRVYNSGATVFFEWNQESLLTDKQGRTWKVTEDALIGPYEERLPRLAAHRAFWFGWHAQFPNTRLIR